jgi:hypothetical protein
VRGLVFLDSVLELAAALLEVVLLGMRVGAACR